MQAVDLVPAIVRALSPTTLLTHLRFIDINTIDERARERERERTNEFYLVFLVIFKYKIWDRKYKKQKIKP